MSFSVGSFHSSQTPFTPSATSPKGIEQPDGMMAQRASAQQLERKMKELQEMLQHLQEAQKSGQKQGSQNPQEQMDDILKQIQMLTREIKDAKANKK